MISHEPNVHGRLRNSVGSVRVLFKVLVCCSYLSWCYWVALRAMLCYAKLVSCSLLVAMMNCIVASACGAASCRKQGIRTS